MTTVARHPSAQTRTSERGFTLIELSIVLVIIGLLVGGILQGQEMINNTRLKSTIAQIDGLTAAVQTFGDKYRQIPGDANAPVTTVIGATVTGNGNGFVANDAAASNGVGLAAAATEAPRSLEHLIVANLLTGAVASGNTTAYEARLDNTFLDMVTVTGLGGFATGRLAVRVRGDSGAGAPANGISPADAFSIDTRYDDGVVSTGRFQATGGATCLAAGAYVAGTDQTCIAGMLID